MLLALILFKGGGDILVVISLLFFILPVALLIFIVAFAVKNKEQGGEKVVRHLYTYLVLFATLMMVIGGGVSIFMATADLVSPTGYYQSFTEYKQMVNNGKIEGSKTELTEEELRSNYDLYVTEEKQRQKDRAVNQIIKSLGFIVIPLPVFLYFNRLRKQYKE
jgi:glucan phosphoethanolaminetransferase (alkaline phosphatase superfamily)